MKIYFRRTYSIFGMEQIWLIKIATCDMQFDIKHWYSCVLYILLSENDKLLLFRVLTVKSRLATAACAFIQSFTWFLKDSEWGIHCNQVVLSAIQWEALSQSVILDFCSFGFRWNLLCTSSIRCSVQLTLLKPGG